MIASHKELTHAVSHELRTPLARLRFGLEIIALADNRSEREKQLEEIKRNVDELDTLVSEMLTDANFDQENFKPKMELIDIDSWLRELAVATNNEKPTVPVDYLSNGIFTDSRILISPKFFGRAIRNLLQNAGRYSKSRIHLTLETDNFEYRIHVDDDGHGIPESDRQRIFEPFVRLNASRERETGGYGLGLPIVKRVSLWHEGAVDATESPIGGASFTLFLPIKLADHDYVGS